ncbi:MAG: hypothetical protein OET16_12650 [Chromatiales bacterium]|jgi:hypothetical protein|nr:hypothetical protein [Chromatiales bacterium]
MTARSHRLVVYAAIAITAYLLGAGFGGGAAIAAFLVLGVVAELFFWVELFRRGRRRGPK